MLIKLEHYSAAKLLPKMVLEQYTEHFLITFKKIANLNKRSTDKFVIEIDRIGLQRSSSIATNQ